MESTKQQVLEAIANLPDETNLDDIMYSLYVLDCVKKGQEAVQRDDFTTAEELLEGSKKW